MLLGNTWLKLVNANINYRNGTLNIEFQKQKHTIPITCSQRLDPNQYTAISPQNELELEDEDEDIDTMRFNYSNITANQFQIDERIYLRESMEYYNND